MIFELIVINFDKIMNSGFPIRASHEISNNGGGGVSEVFKFQAESAKSSIQKDRLSQILNKGKQLQGSGVSHQAAFDFTELKANISSFNIQESSR